MTHHVGRLELQDADALNPVQDPQGVGQARPGFATPVQGARRTSGFGWRLHPPLRLFVNLVLRGWRCATFVLRRYGIASERFAHKRRRPRCVSHGHCLPVLRLRCGPRRFTRRHTRLVEPCRLIR